MNSKYSSLFNQYYLLNKGLDLGLENEGIIVKLCTIPLIFSETLPELEIAT